MVGNKSYQTNLISFHNRPTGLVDEEEEINVKAQFQ